MTQDEVLSTQAAAEYLAEQLPDKEMQQWAMWLRNNRNHSRSAIYRVPSERIGRVAFYRPHDLAKFVDFEKSRLLGTLKLGTDVAEILQAYGIGQADSTHLGRKFKGASANLTTTTDGAAVQTVINEPLTVLLMSAEEAIAFGKELVEAGQAAQRINGTAPRPAEDAVEVIADTKDARISRRKLK